MKRYRKKRTGETVPLSAERPNHVWCLDFVFDACLNGTKLKILAVKDEFTKGCLALEVRTRFRSGDVQRTLRACFEQYGVPERLRRTTGASSSPGRSPTWRPSFLELALPQCPPGSSPLVRRRTLIAWCTLRHRSAERR